MSEKIQSKEIEVVIGKYADYLDTGIWNMDQGDLVAPDDLTVHQLKDFLRVFGGYVYLRNDQKLAWFQAEVK